jgi:hypothetical protein
MILAPVVTFLLTLFLYLYNSFLFQVCSNTKIIDDRYYRLNIFDIPCVPYVALTSLEYVPVFTYVKAMR